MDVHAQCAVDRHSETDLISGGDLEFEKRHIAYTVLNYSSSSSLRIIERNVGMSTRPPAQTRRRAGLLPIHDGCFHANAIPLTGTSQRPWSGRLHRVINDVSVRQPGHQPESTLGGVDLLFARQLPSDRVMLGGVAPHILGQPF